MRQNNHFIWYIPYFFLMFFSLYLGLKFVFIFFFKTAYVPPFIFDFTPFFILNGFEYTHLLFLAFTTVFIDMYLHVAVSKKHSCVEKSGVSFVTKLVKNPGILPAH